LFLTFKNNYFSNKIRKFILFLKKQDLKINKNHILCENHQR
jgi:hypothetical protein